MKTSHSRIFQLNLWAQNTESWEFFSRNAWKHTGRVNYRVSQMSNYIFIAPILPLSPQN